jgi:tRNA(Ile)-lysidine synthase TilS/MesJ
MSYSGGKDSTYTLALLRESYDLNVLAVTLDNGFMPEQTTKNIRLMSERLGFDHILYRPRFDVLKKIFSASTLKDLFPLKTLTRASSICTSCISFVKFFTQRTAVEKS